MEKWHVYLRGQQIGPVDESELPSMGITPDTLVWRPGMTDWRPASQMPELSYLFTNSQSTPPPFSAQNAYSAPAGSNPYSQSDISYISSKSKVPAGVLAILLGGVGAQYFYLGKIGAGFLTILLSLLTCGIWATLMFVQGIYMLTLDEAEFQRKYVDTNSFMPIF